MAKNLQFSNLLDFYGDMLTEKQREATEYYYNEDLSLAEIAADQGITRQGVRDAIQRSQEQLLEMEEKLGLAAKFSVMISTLEEIRAEAFKIKQINQKLVFSREINACIDKIENLVLRLTDC